MKTTKKLLAVLLSVVMAFSVSAVAFAEDENWVPVKTSGDALEKGDLYLDLASVRDMYIERVVYEDLCDYVTPKDPNWSPSDPPRFNNLAIVACEKLANLYPELWEAAIQQTLAANPSWAIDDFYTIQESWDVLFEMVKEAHPELGFRYWQDLDDYGYDYIVETYPEALDAATAAAEADFAVYENASWYYDSNFVVGYHWLKAEDADGEELWMIPEQIAGTFTEYGVEWQPVAADIASVEGEGGYYLNGNDITVALSEEEKDSIRENYAGMINHYIDRLPTDIAVGPDETIHVETEEELSAALSTMAENEIARREADMAAYYAAFFDGAALLVNPDENSMFQISLTKTYTDFGGSFEFTTYYPFSEKTYMEMPVKTEQIWDCINAYAWTWDGETACVTVTTGLGDEIETVAAEVSFATTTEPQVGVAGEKLATATATVDGTELTATKTFAIPALDPADDPETPVTPTDPDEPTGDNLCPWDNVDHGNSFWGKLIRFFHGILYFFAHLFGKR